MDLTSILFEDNHLIVINKKPSEIVQGDKTGDKTMADTIKEYLKVKYNPLYRRYISKLIKDKLVFSYYRTQKSPPVMLAMVSIGTMFVT